MQSSNVEPVIPRASECFCGCGRRPEGSGQLASNLLGWEMNEQISALMKPAILFDALHPDRDPTRYIRARARHAQAWRPQLWLGTRNRGPLTANGIYQMIARGGRQYGMDVFPHRFRHHFSHTWLDCGGAEGNLMELNGWTSPQMLRRYGASARSARARRTYDRIMDAPMTRLAMVPGNHLVGVAAARHGSYRV
jgi:hypothetical protein